MCASHTGEDKHVRTLQAHLPPGQREPGAAALRHGGRPGGRAHRGPPRARRRDARPHPPRLLGVPRREHPPLPPTRAGRWPTTTDPAHPSQVAVRETVARLFGRRPAALRTSPDDCGVLTYEVPLVEVARAYLLLADPEAPRRMPRALGRPRR